MKFAKILFFLTAASLSGTHAATVCCDTDAIDSASGIIRQGAGNATLSLSSSFAGSGSIVGATNWLALGSARIMTPAGARLVSSSALLSSDSVFSWEATIAGTERNGLFSRMNLADALARSGPIHRTVVDLATFSDPFDMFSTGASIGVLAWSTESVVELVAPITVVDAGPDSSVRAIPEPSSVAISSLLVAAGLLRRRRVA